MKLGRIAKATQTGKNIKRITITPGIVWSVGGSGEII